MHSTSINFNKTNLQKTYLLVLWLSRLRNYNASTHEIKEALSLFYHKYLEYCYKCSIFWIFQSIIYLKFCYKWLLSKSCNSGFANPSINKGEWLVQNTIFCMTYFLNLNSHWAPFNDRSKFNVFNLLTGTSLREIFGWGVRVIY